MSSRSRHLLLALPSLVLLACGGVDVTPSGTGGTSSSHVGTSTGKGSSATAGSLSTASGPTLSLCDQFCKATGSCFEDCQQSCHDFQVSPCEAEGAALVSCLGSSYDPTTCTPSGDCQGTYQAFTTCRAAVQPDCGPPICSSSTSTCACTAKCTGGERKALCAFQKNGAATCSCYLGGILFLTCGGLPTTVPTATQCAITGDVTGDSCCGMFL